MQPNRKEEQKGVKEGRLIGQILTLNIQLCSCILSVKVSSLFVGCRLFLSCAHQPLRHWLLSLFTSSREEQQTEYRHTDKHTASLGPRIRICSTSFTEGDAPSVRKISLAELKRHPVQTKEGIAIGRRTKGMGKIKPLTKGSRLAAG